MNFQWALEMLEKGKKVRRTCWEVETYMEKSSYGAIVSNKGTKAYFMIEHFKADDWIEFKEVDKIILEGMGKYRERTFAIPSQISISEKMLGKLTGLDCLKIFGMRVTIDNKLENEVMIY